MTSIKGLLGTKQKMLLSDLEANLSHPTSKGDHCEGAWISFLRSFLPDKYKVDKGFVFDSKGNLSDQIDIIIYDALYTPLIFETSNKEKFITAESVYAVFEAKQHIDKGYLEYTQNKIESVTKLYRSSREMIVAGDKVKPRPLTKIIGGILATNSISSDAVKSHLNEFDAIDLGCALDEFTFIVNRRNKEKLDVMFSNKEEGGQAFFYCILDELYKIGTIGGIDIRDYADFSLDSIKLERED